METPLELLSNKLSAGLSPTCDDLEAALKQSLVERDEFQKSTVDLSQWLMNMVVAHVANDLPKVEAILVDFIVNRVKFEVEPASPSNEEAVVH
ncbi:hypothetical protein [Undibacterium danionis]|uniref:Uncharacterized protein n=1 Tax=Undibacterium danionis TaxID=1812100 RepID=A0ABV6ID18_9BURK